MDSSKLAPDARPKSSFDLDDDPGMEVLLRISDNTQATYRYLIFKSGKLNSGEVWKLVGFIDHDISQYQVPQHYFFISHGRAWLVVTVQERWGTGFALYYDRIFTITGGQLREVLELPSEGHLSSFSMVPTVNFSSRIMDYEKGSGVESLLVEFSSSYSAEDLFTWMKRQLVVFSRTSDKKDFSFNPNKSQMSQRELNLLFELSGTGNEDLLKYNYAPLVKVARGSNLESKLWIGRFLNQCEAGPDTKRLRQLLR